MTLSKHRALAILAVAVLAIVAFLASADARPVSADGHTDGDAAPAAAIFPGYDWVNQNAVLDQIFLELTGVPWGQAAAEPDEDAEGEGTDEDAGDGMMEGPDDEGSTVEDDDDGDETAGSSLPRCYTIRWVAGLWSIPVEVPCP